MDATVTFVVRKQLAVAHEKFLRIFSKPARALRLRGEIVAHHRTHYHFRMDGRPDAVKEFLAFVSIGAPAFGTLSGVYLWIGEDLYTGEEALRQRPTYLLPPDDPRDDSVVPESYIPQVRP